MTKSYQIVSPPGSSPTLDPQRIAELLAKDGQLILPLLDLLESAQCALDDLIDVMGRATIEAVLHPLSTHTPPSPERKTSPCTSLASSLASQATTGATLAGL